VSKRMEWSQSNLDSSRKVTVAFLDIPEFSQGGFKAYKELFPMEVFFPKVVPGGISANNIALFRSTLQTPILCMVHDGSFDIFDLEEPDSQALEKMTKTGDHKGLVDESGSAYWYCLVGDRPMGSDKGAFVHFELKTSTGQTIVFFRTI
jgi:hypothetical protein